MIGKLKGIVDAIEEDHVIVDVGGVGYSVFVHPRLKAALAVGAPATIIIETHVREDHIHLYGFADAVEREWFKVLTSVERVGSKMGLNILGYLSPDQLVAAIVAKDTTAFTQISGVGGKLAERIVVELKDKALKMPTSGLSIAPSKNKGGKITMVMPNAGNEEAISALVNLGYSRTEAYMAAQKARTANENADLNELIKLSLKELAR